MGAWLEGGVGGVKERENGSVGKGKGNIHEHNPPRNAYALGREGWRGLCRLCTLQWQYGALSRLNNARTGPGWLGQGTVAREKAALSCERWFMTCPQVSIRGNFGRSSGGAKPFMILDRTARPFTGL